MVVSETERTNVAERGRVEVRKRERERDRQIEREREWWGGVGEMGLAELLYKMRPRAYRT